MSRLADAFAVLGRGWHARSARIVIEAGAGFDPDDVQLENDDEYAAWVTAKNAALLREIDEEFQDQQAAIDAWHAAGEHDGRD